MPYALCLEVDVRSEAGNDRGIVRDVLIVDNLQVGG